MEKEELIMRAETTVIEVDWPREETLAFSLPIRILGMEGSETQEIDEQ